MRQGDAIATLLFNVMLETVVTRYKGKHREPYLTGVVNLWRVLML